MFFKFLSLFSQFKTYIRIRTLRKKIVLSQKIGKKVYVPKSSDRIFILIAHVVTNLNDNEKLERFKQCIDSLLMSFNDKEISLHLLSKHGFSVADKLPEYISKHITVHYSEQEDPMYVEYDAFDVFKNVYNEYDFFLFLEDDLIIRDSWFIEKIKTFNSASSSPHFLLLPHRFEYSSGVKYYLDQLASPGLESKAWTYGRRKFTIEGISYCLYTNPHAALYCLNKVQMGMWIESGYNWKNQVVAAGILESAVTFCHYENFEFIKPSPECITFFEVQHFGDKYIKQHQVL